MSVQPSGSPARWLGTMWRLAARHPGCAILLFAVLIGAAGLTLLLAGVSMPGAGIVMVSQIVLLVLSPMLLFGATCYALRGVRTARRLMNNRRAEMNPHSSNPPIEQMAADLRRLLWRHDMFVRSSDIPMRARRLWALAAAFTDYATQAARAFDVPHPDQPAGAGLDKPQPRRLLRTLAAEGLMLPPAVQVLAPDGRC